ncbi:MAG: PEP-CTERM sorting domain-containing protein [Planctomycetota bacterium]
MKPLKLVCLAISLALAPLVANAQIVFEVSDDGPNLRFTTTGSFDLTGLPGVAFNFDEVEVQADLSRVLAVNGGAFRNTATGGAPTGNDPIISPTFNQFLNGVTGGTYVSGTGFGYLDGQIFWDDDFGANPSGVITPTAVFTFPNTSVAQTFGTNLDAGPVEVWLGDGGTTGGSTSISIGLASAAVPEPSSFLTLGLIGLICTGRRRAAWIAQMLA